VPISASEPGPRGCCEDDPPLRRLLWWLDVAVIRERAWAGCAIAASSRAAPAAAT